MASITALCHRSFSPDKAAIRTQVADYFPYVEKQFLQKTFWDKALGRKRESYAPNYSKSLVLAFDIPNMVIDVPPRALKILHEQAEELHLNFLNLGPAYLQKINEAVKESGLDAYLTLPDSAFRPSYPKTSDTNVQPKDFVFMAVNPAFIFFGPVMRDALNKQAWAEYRQQQEAAQAKMKFLRLVGEEIYHAP